MDSSGYAPLFKLKQPLKPKKVPASSALSPLTLLTLAACGGGGGGSSPNVSGFGVSGNAVAGPINGAVAFVDYDEDGTLDAGEPYAYTNALGAFSLTSTDADAPIVVTTDSTTAGGLTINAIDTSSDTSLSGVTLKAPSGSSVVSPTSTVAFDLMKINGLNEAEVATALGLEGVAILSFNPYAPGVDVDTALKVEKVASQVMTTVKSVAAAAEGAGAVLEDAANEAFSALVTVVQAKAAAGSSFDLTNTADLALLETQASNNLASASGIDTSAFNTILDTAMDSVEVVNTAIKNITDTDLSSSANKGVFAASELLKSQVKTAAIAEKASAGSGAASITLKDSNSMTKAATSISAQSLTTSLSDSFEVSNLLQDAGYSGSTAFDDGYLVLKQSGTSVELYIDPLGNGSPTTKLMTISGQGLGNLSALTFNQTGSLNFSYESTSTGSTSLQFGSPISVASASSISGTRRSETLDGTSGDDVIDSAGGNDVVDGGGGNDTLLIYEPSSDFTVTTLAGVTRIVGDYTAGNYAWDEIISTNVEKVQFSDKTVTLDTTTPASIISGTTRSETLTGTSGDDVIDSAGGDDVVNGGGGNDTLLIYEPSSDFTVTTLAGVTRIVGDYTAGNYAWDEIISTNVEKIQFSDKTVTLDTTTPASIISGTRWSETLTGTSGDDVIDSAGGNDVVNGGGGDDTLLIYEPSSDFTVTTLAGVTRIVGDYTAGKYAWDEIISTNVEKIQFSDKTVTLDTTTPASIISGTRWSETLTGTSGDDVIDSAGGNDVVNGGGGDDTLLIYEPSSDFTVTTLAGVTRIVGDYTAGNYAWDEIISTNVEKIQFSDKTVTLDTTTPASIISGTRWSETLTGTSGDDVIDSAGGNDVVNGGGGDDTLLIYEPSSDFTVTTLAGVTRIVGDYTAGNYAYDEIISTNVEKIQFSDKTVTLDTTTPASIISGTRWSETLTGTSGDDVIDSAGGNDVVNGGGGDDTLLIYEPSSDFTVTTLAGVTRIVGDYTAGNYAWDEIISTNVEKIQFSDKTVTLDTTTPASIISGTRWSETLTGTSGDDVIDSAGGNDVVNGGGGDDTLLIYEPSSDFTVTTLAGVTRIVGDYTAGKYAWDEIISTNVEKIQFSDKTVTLDTTTPASIISGTRWSETLTGTSGDDVIDSAGGNDVVNGGGGDDTLLIYEPSSDFTVTTLAGVTRIVGDYTAGNYAYDEIFSTNVEKIQFSDKTVTLDTTTPASIISGTTRSETLTGTSGDDVIDSAGGNDVVNGGGGDDTLLIYEPSSDFTVTTLAGVTRIVGDYTAGNYAYDEIFSTNVEKIQFSDKTVTLDTSGNHVIVGSAHPEWVGSTQDEVVYSTARNQKLDAVEGSDTFVIFGASSDYNILRTKDGDTVVTAKGVREQYKFGKKQLTSFEQIEFVDKSVDISYRSLNFSFEDKVLVEGGTPLQGSINLTRAPTSDVTVDLTASQTISLSKSSIVFTPQNWNVSQNLQISFGDNTVIDPFDEIVVDASFASNDSGYNGLTNQSLTLNFLDNDIQTVGEITGGLWLDANRNSVNDQSESPIQIGTAYLDLNVNGSRDAEEPASIIRSDGTFSFSNLKPGTYSVGLDIPASHVLTYPSGQQSGTVNLTSSGETSSVEISQSDSEYHKAYQKVIEADSILTDFGYDGTGQTVVVIDTGIDLDHDLFGADADGNGVADKILFSKDFTSETDNTASDENGHGTHVAGTIAGVGADYPGVAPGASIIALQALTASGNGSGTGLQAALQWCGENAQKYNITAINMSLSFKTNDAVAREWFITDEMAALTQLGVAVVSSSGNDYANLEKAGVSYPSSDPYSLSVGATFHSDVGPQAWPMINAYAFSSETDQVAPFSQRSPDLTTVLAPGVLIPSAWHDGSIKSISGTSMAAPVVTGAIAIIQEASESLLGRRLSVNELNDFFAQNSDSIFDGDNENDGLTHTESYYPRLNIENLVNALQGKAEPGFHRLELAAGEVADVSFGVALDISSEFDAVNAGSSVIVGSSSADTITGSSGDDIVRAGGGNDIIFGNGGTDDLDGGGGNDTYVLTGSGSSINVGNGFDHIILETGSTNIVIRDFEAGTDSSQKIAIKEGTASADLIIGSDMVIDLIRGGDGNDEIYGFASSDFLFGGSGRDTLAGGSGTDFLFADTGGGSLSGGADGDYFVFKTSNINKLQTAQHVSDFEIVDDSFIVVIDADYDSFSIQHGSNKTKVFSGDTLVADITLNETTTSQSDQFLLSHIDFVLPSYFNELETYLSSDLV